MDGKALAARIRADVAREVAELGHVGLATVLVGDDPASDVYIRLKHSAATEAGIDARDIRLRRGDVRGRRSRARRRAERGRRGRRDPRAAAAPVPHRRDARHVRGRAVKDVDGFHPVNAGNLYLGTPLHVPATPAGCMELLAEYGVDPKGKDAVVIGRSEIVGRPAAMLLLQAHATVTICHSRTADLGAEVRRARHRRRGGRRPRHRDAGHGQAGRDGARRRPDAGEDGKIRGDVDPAVAEVAGLLTPMPGGTGPMTIAMLLESAVKAARYRRGILAYPTL